MNRVAQKLMHHISGLWKNPFSDGWSSPLLALGSSVLHQTHISGITLAGPSHNWISCCVWGPIVEAVHHVAICLCTSSLLSHVPRNQHPAVWITIAVLSSVFPFFPIELFELFQLFFSCWTLTVLSLSCHSAENIKGNVVNNVGNACNVLQSATSVHWLPFRACSLSLSLE